ncbi:hypothetical protein [Roseovarius nanhaiticus]|uniref:hypothetical protein n=1 Tax=Roseovarius nanhaiticus TaxID=573024 RepID=UPI00249099A4|nr:hypothetical protein [Roseovarius nanhaiticus]
MDIALIQTHPCDLIQLLKTLRTKLPRTLVDRVSDLDLTPDADLPRQIGHLPDATEEEEAQLIAALDALGEKALHVQRGTLVVQIAPAEVRMGTRMDIGAIVDLLRPDLAHVGALPRGAAEDIWKTVLERTASGVPFPQEGYEGEHAKAYASIIQQFDGFVPHEDGGRHLKPSDMDRLKRHRIKRHVWTEVTADLHEILTHFVVAREWLDSGGKLRNYTRDQMFAKLGFMVDLNNKYGLCKETAKVPLSLDIAAAITGKLLMVANPSVGFAFGMLWKVVAAQRPGGGEVKAKIAEMHAALFEVFEQTIQTLEQALIALVADWGNLSTFVAATQSGAIDWPDDAMPLRRAHAVGYHTACLMTLMKLKSDTETYKSGLDSHTWGVVQYSQQCSATKRHYDDGKGILRGKSTEPDCLGGRWNYSWFFGNVHTSPGSGYGPPPPKIKLAPAALANKLFLAGTDSDPGLGLSTHFFDKPDTRAAWQLHSVRTKLAGTI